MANYNKIIERWPEVADFVRNRLLIGFRGDVLAYRANFSCDSFSIDGAGFRHSTLGGKTLALADCLQSDRYGIVLGASNLFGFGVAGNENCTASLLAEQFGFPFANAAMPGGNSRNLHSLLVGLLVGSPRPPAVVVLSNGGDLANFCESSTADPIFGSPNHAQLKARHVDEASIDPEQGFSRALTFNSLWTSAIATTCRAYSTKLVLVHQSTFFEKPKATPVERECGLGEPLPKQESQFANHRKYNAPFFDQRRALAERLGTPLAGIGLTGQLTFLDEFHCDPAGIRVMSEAIAKEVEPLL